MDAADYYTVLRKKYKYLERIKIQNEIKLNEYAFYRDAMDTALFKNRNIVYGRQR